MTSKVCFVIDLELKSLDNDKEHLFRKHLFRKHRPSTFLEAHHNILFHNMFYPHLYILINRHTVLSKSINQSRSTIERGLVVLYDYHTHVRRTFGNRKRAPTKERPFPPKITSVVATVLNSLAQNLL
jgi:hypothetical protein